VTCALGSVFATKMKFEEIGLEEDQVDFLVQGIPAMSVSRMVTIIKSVTAKEVFQRHASVKKLLWGGGLWTSGYYANTVGLYSMNLEMRG